MPVLSPIRAPREWLYLFIYFFEVKCSVFKVANLYVNENMYSDCPKKAKIRRLQVLKYLVQSPEWVFEVRTWLLHYKNRWSPSRKSIQRSLVQHFQADILWCFFLGSRCCSEARYSRFSLWKSLRKEYFKHNIYFTWNKANNIKFEYV